MANIIIYKIWLLLIDSFLSSDLGLNSELSSLVFGTFNPRRIGKTCWKRVILKTAYVRIKMILNQSLHHWKPYKTGFQKHWRLEYWSILILVTKLIKNSAKLSAKQAENAIIDYPNTKMISKTMSIWVFNAADSESKTI